MNDPGTGSGSDGAACPEATLLRTRDSSHDARIRLASLPPGFAAGATRAQFADWVAEADPDGVVLLGSSPRARQRLSRHGSIPILDPHVASASPTAIEVGPTTVQVAVTSAALESSLADSHSWGVFPPVVVTTALELHVDTTALSTTLEGRGALEGAPTDGQHPLVLSTEIPAGYRNLVDGVQVIGVGDPDDPGDPGLATVQVRADGTVLTESIDPDRLGLRALTGVGSSRADTLRQAGFDTREAVAEASMAALQDLPGFGVDVAETVQASASAIANGEIHLQSHASLPVTDPLFVDIETDGLHPTVTWLVGVLDGDPTDGTYHSFVNRDPDDPGRALEGFVEWYVAEGEGRPLVAYNGRRFDFPVLRDHLRAYRPGLLADFERADTFDPLAWAVTEEHAVLPGRTNRLEDVAAALGFADREEGVTGAAVARAYRAWLQAPGAATEPDWDRFDRYCEDDTRALATVHRALAEATAAAGSRDGNGPPPTRTETTQGTLGQW